MSAAVAVKERQLIYRTPMIRALLNPERPKTRTSWAIDPQPPADRDRCWVEYPHGKPMANYRSFPEGGSARTGLCEFPHGDIGDRFWVRETWALLQWWPEYSEGFPTGDGYVEPWLDPIPKAKPRGCLLSYRADAMEEEHPHDRGFDWRPSIHMPRWACRIVLETTIIDIHRAHAMTAEDALAEGVAEYAAEHGFAKAGLANPVETFARLWDGNAANKDFPWASNPWIWAVSFRRIESEVPS